MQQFHLAFLLSATVALVVATLVAGGIGSLGFPLPPDDRRLGYVDGLRGYLALSVLIHHYYVWTQSTRLGGSWGQPSIDFINQLGAGSVGLFFMTTGLVFYPRVLAGLRATPWVSVYITRLFRIVPLVTVATGLVTVVIIARTGVMPDRNYIGAAALWISTWGEASLLGYPDSGRINAYVLWSLWYEWLFYIAVLPACSLAMDLVRHLRLPTVTVPAILFGMGIAGRLVARVFDWPVGVFAYLPLFALGMIAFELRPYLKDRAALNPLVTCAAAVALLIGMVFTKYPYSISLPLFGFFFAVVAGGNSMGGILRTRGALVLGECSFSIYLLHGIVLDILFVDVIPAIRQPSLALFPVLLLLPAIIVTLVTPATYLLVERPAIRMGRSLSRWVAARRVVLDSRELDVAP